MGSSLTEPALGLGITMQDGEHRARPEQIESLSICSGELAEIAPPLLELAQRLFAADAYALWRRFESGEWRAIADAGLSADYPRHISPPSASLPPQVLQFENVASEPMLEGRRAVYVAEGIRSILAIPVALHGELSATFTFYYRSPRRFEEDEIRLATGLASLAGRAITTAELHLEQQRLRQAAEAAERRAAFLAQASSMLASSLDYQVTLQRVANLTVPVLADWCVVHLSHAGQNPTRVAVAHVDPEKLRWERSVYEQLRYDPHSVRGLANVLRTGKTELYPRITDEMLVALVDDPQRLEILRKLGLTSVIIAPLIARDQVLGAITLISAESGVQYDQKSVELAEDLAQRAAVAIDNARLYQDSQQALRALARSEARFRRLVEANIIGIQFCDERGRIMEANEAFLRMTGYSQDDLDGGRLSWSLLTGEGSRAAAPLVGDGVQQTPLEIELVRNDGTRFPALEPRKPCGTRWSTRGASSGMRTWTRRSSREDPTAGTCTCLMSTRQSVSCPSSASQARPTPKRSTATSPAKTSCAATRRRERRSNPAPRATGWTTAAWGRTVYSTGCMRRPGSIPWGRVAGGR
jgi:PAS domain S-box-containing protein